MSVEAEVLPSTFFDPISLEEVPIEWGIKIKNETFNVKTLLDWMANDIEFGIQSHEINYCKNTKFINPATAQAFSSSEVKMIYEFGLAKGILENHYSYFEKADDKKLFLKKEISGQNGDLGDINSINCGEFLQDFREFISQMEVNIISVDYKFKDGEKISSYKGTITRYINKFYKKWDENKINSLVLHSPLQKKTYDILNKRLDELMEIRSKW